MCVLSGKDIGKRRHSNTSPFFSSKILKMPHADANSHANHYLFNTFSIDLPEIPGPTLGEECFSIQVVPNVLGE